MPYIYLVNLATGKIHDLLHLCAPARRMSEANRKPASTLVEGCDRCQFCNAPN